MNTAAPQARRAAFSSYHLLRLFAALLTLSCSGVVYGQTSSPTDGSTPSGLKPGSPSGSYELSGFDNVNLFNGNLSFHLPLLSVGGRGSAGYPVTLEVSANSWRVKHSVVTNPNTGLEEDVYLPEPNWWTGLKPGYGPGVLQARQSGDNPTGTCQGASGGVTRNLYMRTLTRLTFTASDGTEYELRDQQTGGQPADVPDPCGQGFSRGQVFVTTDGTAATFISDAPIVDRIQSNPSLLPVSGYLMLKDGTQYRVNGSSGVKWMRDRDGNVLTFDTSDDGAGHSVYTITDSLGRKVTVTYGVQDAAPYGLCDRIVFEGFGGAQRVVRVSKTSLAGALRSGYTIQTYRQLFPELINASSVTQYNPTDVVSAVWLPDDGVNHRAYKLYYNSFGELARLELPTGGAIEYDHTPSSGAISDGVDYQIYRRVVGRRVYPDGVTLEGKMTYSASVSGGTFAETTAVTADSLDPGGTLLLARSVHYFYGDAGRSLFQSGTDYGPWEDGHEFETEEVETAGCTVQNCATVLRRAEMTWRQRDVVSWWPTPGGTDEPPNDPRLVETKTTIEPSGANLVAKQTSLNAQTGAASFDRYNDPTDVWEYDYGATPGVVGALVRHKHTDYVTTNTTGGTTYDYACDPATTCSNASINTGVVHLRGLPKQQSVYDAAGVEQARTTFEYDNYAATAPHASLTPRAGITGMCAYFDAAANCYGPDDPNHPPASYVTRGNVTATTKYLLTNGAVTGSVTAYGQYDVAGNVVESIDANGNASMISFDDSFCNDNVRCGGSFTPSTYAFPKSVTSPVPDASTLYGYTAGTFGSTTAFTTSIIYDYYTGLTYSTTDANGQTTALSYKDSQGNLDPLDRLKAVVRPDGSRTDFNYNDAVGNLYVQVLTDLDAGRRTESRQYFDGLGRGVRSFTWENQDTNNPWLTVDTQYDALGRAWEVSNQYRSATPSVGTPSTINPLKRWTQTAFDALGRATQVLMTADGAIVTTAYSGDKVLVTDQAGKQRMSRSDALGRLTDVWEVTPADPSTEGVVFQGASYAGYRTTYGYDVLGNLRAVTQAGQQNGQQVTEQRSFVYDSLSRLTSATNPESGTVSYTYDADGNLQTKTDARGVTATYRYDHLNRNIIVTYATTGTTSAATPTVYRYYDFAANGKGRLYRSEAASTAQTTFTTYDVMGRPTDYQQKFWTGGAWGQAYAVHQDYNLAGAVTSERYPSQHTVSYNYDAAGRVGDNGTQPAFSGTLGDAAQRTYASQVVYDPTGGMNQERFGTDTPVYNKHFYNVRGQLNEIRVSTYAFTDTANQTNWNRGAILNVYSAAPSDGWTASGPDNNGNLRKQMIYVPNDDAVTGSALYVESFDYDSLNRLSWYDDKYNNATLISHQAYQYDRWGNRTVDSGSTTNAPAPQFSVNAANRLGVPAGQSGAMTYDAAGNLTNDTYQGGRGGGGTRVYDAENRMTSAQYVSGQLQTAASAYDADGRRIKRNVGTAGEVWQVYGIGGELLAEYAANASPTSPQKEYGYRGGELLVTATAPTAGWGPAPSFYENPLNPNHSGETPIRSRHITELRSAIDSLRSHLGLGGYPWSAHAAAGDPVSIDPIVEMRTALDQALGAPAEGYTAGLASRLPVLAAHIQELRQRVLDAWQGGGSGVDIRWLVEDQLGTPRMVIDHTGSLAGVARHDYFPFGEEMGADANWRTAARGYSAGDTIRQKFTGKERDSEMGLDFFEARYYSSMQGRFTSVDPLTITPERMADPQRINLYAYVRNNPLGFTDSTGMIIDTERLDEEDLERWEKIVAIINAKDKNGNLLHPKLNALYNKLQNDERTFYIQGGQISTAGRFEVETFKGENDFSAARITLDFDKIKEANVAEALFGGFKQFEDLKTNEDRFAEVTGHEFQHGADAIDDPANAVRVQRLINETTPAIIAANRARVPISPDVQKKLDELKQRLEKDERSAYGAEREINRELRPPPKKKKK